MKEILSYDALTGVSSKPQGTQSSLGVSLMQFVHVKVQSMRNLYIMNNSLVNTFWRIPLVFTIERFHCNSVPMK